MIFNKSLFFDDIESPKIDFHEPPFYNWNLMLLFFETVS